MAMDFVKFNSVYSAERVRKYAQAASGDEYLTQILYYHNHRLAKAFHPLLSNLEVVLRNRLDKALANTYSDDKWLLHRIEGYIPSGYRAFTGRHIINNNYLRTCLEKADAKLVKKRREIRHDRLLAELEFGFWTTLYNDGLPVEICAAVMSIFGHLPCGTNRRKIKGILNRIRLFRNRLSHNNTLFFNGTTVDLQMVREIYDSIINVTSFLDAESLVSFRRNGLDKVIEAIKKLDSDLSHPKLARFKWRVIRLIHFRFSCVGCPSM